MDDACGPGASTYEVLPGFRYVLLEESYVLGMRESPDTLEFTLDLVLLRGHPLYCPPAAGEQYCTRRAVLVFPAARRVEWQERRFVPSIDANGEVDFGTVDALCRSGDRYDMSGEWGAVRLTSDVPLLEIEESDAEPR